MTESSRFIVAVHVLTLLASEQGRALPSDYIAGSVNTNPVVIRRLLALLGKARLVSTVEGAGGGTTLARPADQITLADVYQSVESEGELFGSPRAEPNERCPVGSCVQEIARRHAERFEGAMTREMKKVTIADVLSEVRSASRK
jgi:Rrf2 family protein